MDANMFGAPWRWSNGVLVDRDGYGIAKMVDGFMERDNIRVKLEHLPEIYANNEILALALRRVVEASTWTEMREAAKVAAEALMLQPRI